MTRSERPAGENQIAFKQPTADTPNLPNVAENACYCFYAVQPKNHTFPPQLELTLADLIRPLSESAKSQSKPWIPPDARSTITSKRLAQPIWVEAPMDVGTDLHPHIRRLLGAEDGTSSGQIYSYRPSDPVNRLLGGQWLSYPQDLPKEERVPKELGIQLGSSARQRLSRRLGAEPACPLLLSIENIRLVFFRTGHAFVMVKAIFRRADNQPLHPYWLVEAVSSLGRINALAWHQGDKVIDDPKAFSLGDIVRSLVGESEKARAERRVFTASYLQFETAPELQAARQLAIQLSRHYNDHYRIAPDLQSIEVVKDFTNILHVFSLEGCATLVDSTPPPGLEAAAFLENYQTTAYEQHYLPIVLLAFHEFNHLLCLTNDAGFWPDLGDRGSDPIHRLQKLRDQILKFRLCYRFSFVSYISMHNAVNQALRRVLGLDWMLEELNRDTREIDAYLQRVAAERSARRFRWLSIFGGAGLTWLTTFVIVKELCEALHLVSHEAAGIIASGIGLIAGLVAAWATWVRTREAGHSDHGDDLGHLAKHAVQEHVRHHVLK